MNPLPLLNTILRELWELVIPLAREQPHRRRRARARCSARCAVVMNDWKLVAGGVYLKVSPREVPQRADHLEITGLARQ